MTADETIVPQDASNNSDPTKKPAVPSSQPALNVPDEPEPVILEERIVQTAQPKAKTPVTPPAPVEPVQSKPEVPYEAKTIPQLVIPTPDPDFKPTILSEESELKKYQVPAAPPPIERPKPSAQTGISQTSPAEDIAKILKGVKLPERRDFKATADVAPVAPTAPKQEEPKAEQPTPNSSGSSSNGSDEPASSIVTPLRTLKDDLQSIVREQKISLVRAVSLEEDKKRGQEHLAPEQEENRTRRSKRTFGILFAACIFLILGAGALFGVFYVAQQQAATPVPPQSSILFAEQTVTFSLDNQTAQNLKNELAQARTKQLGSLGSIARVVPTIQSTSTNGTAQEVPATLAQFFSALGMNPPAELMTAIGPQFFFGFHVVDTNAPLFVIPVTSYDHAFAGMLAWEPTMDQDLSPVFTSVSPTIQVNGLPEQRTFEDEVLRNYDVRELTDDQGNVVLYYSFPTPNILVIAQSPYSFTEILSRLQAEREL
jgi:hypothetical protein